MKKSKTVAIVGAGVSGLSCAISLKEAGWDVKIYEKSRGVSGRLSTRVNPSWQCDHGAQYFTARDPRFIEEVERWIKADVARIWQPRLKVFDGVNCLDKTERDQTKNPRYVGYPTNNSPSKWIAKDLNIQTETTITEIHHERSGWKLRSKEHGVIAETFDQLVLAIPAPQARVILEKIDTSLIDLCDSVQMRPCFALMINLSQQIDADFDGLFINGGLLTWVARDSSKPGRKDQKNINNRETWVLHACSDWSFNNLGTPSEQVSSAMLGEFKKILYLNNSHLKLDHFENIVIESSLHRWLYADCEIFLENFFGWDSVINLGLCGDWLNCGKIQGAWLSGKDLAQKIIDHNRDLDGG